MKWKVLAGALIARTGYRVYRIGDTTEFTLCPPYGYRTYSPWHEREFREFYAKFGDRALAREDRCYAIYQFSRHCLHLKGQFAECGVYKGGTAWLIANAIAENSRLEAKELHLFDTFSGMPSIANDDPSGLKEGCFGDTSLESVREYLRGFPVLFHPGLIPDTLNEVEDERFAFVNVDVDLYETTKHCCGFFYDRMSKGAVILFDDYGQYPFNHAQGRAVDEFFKDKPEVPMVLRTGQCFVIKM